jgi:hypothetical protein
MPIAAEWMKFAPAPRPLTGKNQWHVFLSYRSADRPWVLNLYDVLREQGFKVFLDQVVLKGGDPLVTRLEDGLSASMAGVLVWSGAARDSAWVRREYQVLEAQASDKLDFQFVPIRLDATELPIFAKTRIFLDFSAYPDGPNGGELLRLVHAISGAALSDEAARFASQQDEAAKAAVASIAAAVRNKDPAKLVESGQRDELPWRSSATLGCQAADGLIKLGKSQCSAAIDLLLRLEQRFPRSIRPKQLHALALARRGQAGDLSAAQEILGALYESGERDPETLGIYGRTWMDRFTLSGDLDDLRSSRDCYAQAFEIARDDYYTGINAAAKSVLIGSPEDLALAAQLGAKVQEIVGDAPHPGDYWKTATAAEVQLMQAKYPQAGKLYAAAVAMARSQTGSHQSSWTQAHRLMAKLHPSDVDRALVRQAFAHLPDGPA